MLQYRPPRSSAGRSPRPIRRMGTEIHADSRTHRRRTRDQDERAMIEEQTEPHYDSAEQDELILEFAVMLYGPTTDGGAKRAKGEKPNWKVDPTHLDAMHRHLHRYDRGELVDSDSGVHPLIHVAWRALAQAWQETQASAQAEEARNPQAKA